MSLQNFKIYFHKFNWIYSPGEILAGHIEILLNSTKIVRGIFIEISGKATVCWSESDSDNNSTRYTNKEKFLNVRIYVLGTGHSESRVQLPCGKNVLPFQFILPTNLPSTFKDKYGKIKYKVKATLDCPWKIDKQIKVPFFLQLSNFQNHPHAKKPSVLTMKKEFGILFKSNPLTAIVRISQSGLAPGQVIPVTFEVQNNSNTAVNGISVKLKQIKTYHGKRKDKMEEKTLTKNALRVNIKPNTSVSLTYSMRVPVDVILYDLSNCNIINIDYGIRIELHTAGLTRNLLGHLNLYPIRTTR